MLSTDKTPAQSEESCLHYLSVTNSVFPSRKLVSPTACIDRILFEQLFHGISGPQARFSNPCPGADVSK
jgi:hypothetical protein